MSMVVLTGWSLTCLNRQSLFFVYCCILTPHKTTTASSRVGLSMPGNGQCWESTPAGFSLPSWVDGAENKALFSANLGQS